MAASKTAGKSAGPDLVPQPHGGALLSGGVPGNKGGTGRPPSAIRRELRETFADLISHLQRIAAGEVVEKVVMPGGEETEIMRSASVADRIRAMDLLAKYGLGTKQEITGPDDGAIPHEISVTRRVVRPDGDS